MVTFYRFFGNGLLGVSCLFRVFIMAQFSSQVFLKPDCLLLCRFENFLGMGLCHSIVSNLCVESVSFLGHLINRVIRYNLFSKLFIYEYTGLYNLLIVVFFACLLFVIDKNKFIDIEKIEILAKSKFVVSFFCALLIVFYHVKFLYFTSPSDPFIMGSTRNIYLFSLLYLVLFSVVLYRLRLLHAYIRESHKEKERLCNVEKNKEICVASCSVVNKSFTEKFVAGFSNFVKAKLNKCLIWWSSNFGGLVNYLEESKRYRFFLGVEAGVDSLLERDFVQDVVSLEELNTISHRTLVKSVRNILHNEELASFRHQVPSFSDKSFLISFGVSVQKYNFKISEVILVVFCFVRILLNECQ